jgi:hypothetical protein
MALRTSPAAAAARPWGQRLGVGHGRGFVRGARGAAAGARIGGGDFAGRFGVSARGKFKSTSLFGCPRPGGAKWSKVGFCMMISPPAPAPQRPPRLRPPRTGHAHYRLLALAPFVASMAAVGWVTVRVTRLWGWVGVDRHLAA